MKRQIANRSDKKNENSKILVSVREFKETHHYLSSASL